MNALDELTTDLDALRDVAAHYRRADWLARTAGRLVVDEAIGEVIERLVGLMEQHEGQEKATRADEQLASINRKAA